jgi:hypothetical protein
MPSESAAGVRRVECALQTRVFGPGRELSVRQEDVIARLAPERETAGGRSGPVTWRRALRRATDTKRRPGVDRAVTVDFPAVECGLRQEVAPKAAAIGKVVAEIEIDGVRLVDDVFC